MKLCFVVRSTYSQVVTYTTTHLAFEAYKRGHSKVVYTTVNSLSFNDDQKVRATVVSPGDGLFFRAPPSSTDCRASRRTARKSP